MTVAQLRFFNRHKKVWATLAYLALTVAVLGSARWTVAYLGGDLYYMATHLSQSDDAKLLRALGRGADSVALVLRLKQLTPENAVIGLPRAGRFQLTYWGLLYPRRVVPVDTREEFERERPTHVLLDGDFPPYPLTDDPRAKLGTRAVEGMLVVQVRPIEPGPLVAVPQGAARIGAALVEGLTLLALGVMLLLIVSPRWSYGRLAFLGLAFLLGIGAHTFLFFSLSLVSLPLTVWSVMTVDGVILLTGLGVISYHSHHRGVFQGIMRGDGLPRLTKTYWVVLALGSIFLLHNLFGNLYWPMRHIDAIVSYDYRAKAIVQQGTVLIWQFFLDSPLQANFFYPFFLTMVNAHHYLLGGSHAKVYSTLMLGAYLAIFYSAIRKRDASALQALTFTILLASNFVVITLTQDHVLNFPQMVYGTLGLFFVLTYITQQAPSDLALSSLCLGLAGWVRTDSIVFVAVACLLMLFAGGRPLRARLLGVMVLGVCYGVLTLPYEYFLRAIVHYDMAASYQLSVLNLLDPQRLFTVLSYLGRYSIAFWTGFLALPWLLIIVADWPVRREARLLLTATLLMQAGWVGLFALIGWPISSLQWKEFMQLSAGRGYINLIPLFLLFIAQSDLIQRVFDVIEGRVSFRLRLEL